MGWTPVILNPMAGVLRRLRQRLKDENFRGQGMPEVFRGQGMPEIASKPPEDRQKMWNTLSTTILAAKYEG